MATIRAISLRLKSVKNIQKITKSMKMVSTSCTSDENSYSYIFDLFSLTIGYRVVHEILLICPFFQVSAAKYARAERELKAARPIGENMEKFYRLEETEESKTDEEKPRKVLYVAVTSDRGNILFLQRERVSRLFP